MIVSCAFNYNNKIPFSIIHSKIAVTNPHVVKLVIVSNTIENYIIPFSVTLRNIFCYVITNIVQKFYITCALHQHDFVPLICHKSNQSLSFISTTANVKRIYDLQPTILKRGFSFHFQFLVDPSSKANKTTDIHNDDRSCFVIDGDTYGANNERDAATKLSVEGTKH